jgi:dolichol-phosphate mannosyltransferase
MTVAEPRRAIATARPRRTVHVVLPAYNEEANISPLLSSIDEAMGDHPFAYSVIVVDDGSRDRTAAVVQDFSRDMPVRLIQHPTNMGLGATLRDGLLAAVEDATDRDIIVTMDADDTHSPGLILQMMRMITEGYDVVVASRYRSESRVYGVPLVRRFVSWAASVLMRTVFPTRGIRDFTCGFRAYRASALRAAFERYGDGLINQEGFQCMVDVLLRLRTMDLIFGEVPFLLRYDRKGGESKMKVWRTAGLTLRLMAVRRLGIYE